MFETDPVAPRLHRATAVIFEGRPPNMNARPGNWQVERRIRDTWLEADTTIATAARLEWERRHGSKWAPLRRCSISVTFIVPDKRRRDWDNLIASTKTRFDALVAAGLILDDSAQVIELISFAMTIEPKQQAAVFEIDEVEE